HELQAQTAALIQRAEQKLAQVGGAGIRVEQPDALPMHSRETARGRIRSVVELADGFEDCLSRVFPDILAAIDYPGDRHRRYTRVARDFVYRHPAAAAPASRSSLQARNAMAARNRR